MAMLWLLPLLGLEALLALVIQIVLAILQDFPLHATIQQMRRIVDNLFSIIIKMENLL
jgi:hypothetical protein